MMQLVDSVPIFGLLGPIEAHCNGRELPLGHARQRSVLAALLLDANRPVSVSVLVKRVWGEDPPNGVHSSLYSYIARLRRVLAVEDFGCTSPVRISRAPTGGYRIEIDTAQVDLPRFEELTRLARGCATDERAARYYEQAALLWRGRALDGADSEWFEGIREDLDNQLTAALLEYQDVMIRLGRPAQLLGRLETTLRARPLDEAVLRSVMRTLQICGRQAEALALFDRARRLLRTELGIDPDPRTLSLYQNILRADEAPDGGTAERVQEHRPPAQLPADIANFVGRIGEVEQLSKILVEGDDLAGRRVLLHGPAGIGKTALALHVAHRLLDRFPDGQLYVNLAGYQPGQAPLHPTVALKRLLSGLGLRPEEAPTDVEEQAALFRSLIVDRRMLILLDDAATGEQITPLLPGAGDVSVLITSRTSMPGMLAAQGLRHISLDALSAGESMRLFESMVGHERVAAETSAAVTICALCTGFPLALRLIAARIAGRPHDSLQQTANQLSDGDRLDLLTVEPDGPPPVKAAFDLSYQALAPRQRALFRQLSTVPGLDFGLDAAAVAADRPRDEVELDLRRLTAIHLVEQYAPERFRFLDLIRLYAQQRSQDDDEQGAYISTLRRVLEYHLSIVTEANKVHRIHGLQPPGQRTIPTPAIRPSSPQAAMHALETEYPNILRSIRAATNVQQHMLAWRLAHALRGFFRLRPYDPEWLDAAVLGMAAAEATGDSSAMAAMHLTLADIHQIRGDDIPAAEHGERAYEAADQAHWAMGKAAAWSSIGRSRWALGQLAAAEEALNRALTGFRNGGYQLGEASMIGGLGRIDHDKGLLREARAAYRKSLAISRHIGSVHGQAVNLFYLGSLCADRGDAPLALRHFRSARRICLDSGLFQGEILIDSRIAAVRSATGDIAGVDGALPRILDAAQRIGDRRIAAEALNHASDALRGVGAWHDALEHHKAAMLMAQRVGYQRGEIHALIGHARSSLADSDYEAAISTSSRAIEISSSKGYRLMTIRAQLVHCEALLWKSDGPSARDEIRKLVRTCEESSFPVEASWGRRLLEMTE